MAERKDDVAEPIIIITFGPGGEPIIKTQNVNYHHVKTAGQDLFTIGDEMHRAMLREEMMQAVQQQMQEARKKAEDAALVAQIAADIKRGSKA
jgi:hypothetical protein